MKSNPIVERQKALEQELRENAKLETKELLEKYNTSVEGLSIVNIDEMIEEYGKNTIEIANNHSLLYKLKEAINNPFNIFN
mgnify:CR=1 FL=1